MKHGEKQISHEDVLTRVHHAQEAAGALMKAFTPLIKAIIYIGSTARREAKAGSDIDLLIILDDTLPLERDILDAYKLEAERLVKQAAERGEKLHLTTLRLTAFWEMLRAGDPVLLTMLRDGYALIDTGFFDPLKRLLEMGRIRPSPEAVAAYAMRAVQSLGYAEASLQRVVRDAAWAVVNAAHAYLMSQGVKPLLPREIPGMLEEKVSFLTVKEKQVIRELVREEKLMEHDPKHQLPGRHVVHLLHAAERIVKKILRETKVGGKPVVRV